MGFKPIEPFLNYQMKDIKLGSVVLSEEANNKGPILIKITYAVLLNLGVEIDNSKMSYEVGEEPRMNFIESIDLVQNHALEIKNRYKLSFEQLAHSAAIATAFIIQQSRNIQAETGFGKAIYHYIEGSKTFPPEFSDSTISNKIEDKNRNTYDKAIKANSKESSVKPWWKIW